MVGRWRRDRAGWSPSAALALVVVVVLLSLPGVAAQTATPVASPTAGAGTPLLPAWLEFGPMGQLLARVVVERDCPSLILDGLAVEMSPRAAVSENFPVVACEATVPFGAGSASIQGQVLPLPAGPLTRIAVIGDSGCRLSDWDQAYQACNDPAAWPFAAVAASVAAWDPDLIVHVGDYLYRESPCPAGEVGCAGSPHGDTWAAWDADFFTPAAAALGAAPWLFLRGNHETCDRNPEGWFRLLDPRPYQAQCQQYTEPYVALVRGLSLAVLDSAAAGDTSVSPDGQAQYARQFALLARMAPAGSWLVTHRQVWGILAGPEGEFEVENATYQAATGGALQADYALIVSGHIHLAETIAFAASADRPPQLVSGNAGTTLEEMPTASPTGEQLGDPAVVEAETVAAFGFLTLEPLGDDWIATQRDAAGAPLLWCVLDAPAMGCTPAQPTG